jgi:hypothetical protein
VIACAGSWDGWTPPPGKTLVISIIYSRIPEGKVRIGLRSKELGHVPLENGELAAVNVDVTVWPLSI